MRLKTKISFIVSLLVIGLFFSLMVQAQDEAATKPPTLKNAATKLENLGGINALGLNTAVATKTDNVYLALGKMINTALNMAAIIAVFFLLLAGWLWMTAAGNEEQIGRAKKMAQSAVIAIFIIFGSYFIYYILIRFFAAA